MFLTGEFSKISRVSKRLLHYYYEIGLLKPARIDPQTGYRYYSARQLPRLNRILALKELGLTLDHIAGMIQADVSDEELKYYVEHDQPHPRKLKARQRQVPKEAPVAGRH